MCWIKNKNLTFLFFIGCLAIAIAKQYSTRASVSARSRSSRDRCHSM